MIVEFDFNRPRAARVLSEACADRLPITADQMDYALREWILAVLLFDDEEAGAIAVLNGVGHIGIKSKYRAKWMPRQTLGMLCDTFRVNKTSVCANNPRSGAWLKRMGWSVVGRTDKEVLYERKIVSVARTDAPNVD